MTKLVLGFAGAAALAMASAANATISLDYCSMTCSGPTALDGTTTTIGYEKSGLGNPIFTEWLAFTNSLGGVYSISLDTSSKSVDFTDAYLTNFLGDTYDLSFLFQSASGSLESWG